MLLRDKENEQVIKFKNYEKITKNNDSLTKHTTRRVAMKQFENSQTKTKTAKTQRKKRKTNEERQCSSPFKETEKSNASNSSPFMFQRLKKTNIKLNLTSTTTMTTSLSLTIKTTTRSTTLTPSLTATAPSPSTSPPPTKLLDLAKTLKIRKMSKVSTTPQNWKCGLGTFPILLLLLLPLPLLVHSQNVINALKSTQQHSTPNSIATATAAIATKYSQPFEAEANDENSFRPIIPKDINLEYISQNVFTKAGQYRVFEPVESDLRATSALTKGKSNVQTKGVETEDSQAQQRKANEAEMNAKFQRFIVMPSTNTAKSKQISHENVSSTKLQPPPNSAVTPSRTADTAEGSSSLAGEMKGIENLLAEYVDNFFNKGQYQPKPELLMALQQNYTEMKQQFEQNVQPHLPELALEQQHQQHPHKARPARQAITKHKSGELSVNLPRAFETGRLLFFAGLKKVMWPIYMGLQILKSLMFALLLPTLIGSFGKLLGNGITSGSAPLFIRPMDEPQDLDFKDNNFNFDDDNNKFSLMDDPSTGAGNVKGNGNGGYAYNQAEASQTHNQYAYNAATLNQQALSRFSFNERQQLMQDSYLSALQSLGAASFKNSNGLLGSSSSSGGAGAGGGGLTAPTRAKPAAAAVNTFQQFQKVPASSLLLSNYDPFYSPLLSRLDSVFAQLKLNSDDENCREKLICLMYANPAKYAPYSNLVSAQLSRELNELRKPTSDNPDILRFFKYMRAAKDGQDGIDCEKSFEKCKEFKDFENPAMVSTYHDINKLVQARKMA